MPKLSRRDKRQLTSQVGQKKPRLAPPRLARIERIDLDQSDQTGYTKTSQNGQKTPRLTRQDRRHLDQPDRQETPRPARLDRRHLDQPGWKGKTKR